jgi:hypothetical protein
MDMNKLIAFLLFCGLFNDAVSMNDELKRIWKEAVMAHLQYYHGLFMERPSKASEELRRVGVPIDIGPEHLPSTPLEHHL